MIIKINNQESNFLDVQNLEALLKQLSLRSLDGIAIAVNDNIVLKKDWGVFKLKEKDSVLIVNATQGG